MPITKSAAATNRLIEALPRKYRQRFLATCKPVELTFAEVLAEPGERIRHVFFPTTSCISLVTPIDGCASLEVGLVGDEGMLGISLILGVGISPLSALVQGEGFALRMDTVLFRRELGLSPALQGMLERYLHVVMGWIPKASVSPVGAAAVNRARHQRQAIREASRGASDGKRRAFPEPAIAVPVCGHNNL